MVTATRKKAMRTKAEQKLLNKVINTTWYRGQPRGFLKTKWRRLFFTSGRQGALTYAKNRRGEIIRVKINPQVKDDKVFFGSLPDLATALGLREQYYKLELKDKTLESEALVEGEAIKRGLKLQIVDSEQIVVFSPKIMEVKSILPYKPKITTTAYEKRGADTPPISKRPFFGRKGTPRITPKTPRLRR